MEIQELNKKQMIWLTLLITFVVSIATGIVTVSLVNQAPKSVPQTINNIIERTIEKVTTVPAAPATSTATSDTKNTVSMLPADEQVLIPIYASDESTVTVSSGIIPITDQTAAAAGAIIPAGTDTTSTTPVTPKPLGQGVIISDVGLVLVDTGILTDKDVYKIIHNKKDFDATVVKKFSNGFTILKISVKTQVSDKKI
jgi:hypothetical protein